MILRTNIFDAGLGSTSEEDLSRIWLIHKVITVHLSTQRCTKVED
jgi:hypothetical protein